MKRRAAKQRVDRQTILTELDWLFLTDALDITEARWAKDQAAKWRHFELANDCQPGGRGTPSAGQVLWEQHREDVLAAWIAEKPGTRPSLWWLYDAPRQPVGTYPDCFWDGRLPEPRQRLGGTGTPSSEVLNYAPDFHLGLPTMWVSAWDEAYYSGRALDVHGSPIGSKNAEEGFAGRAIDPDEPPIFESQAAYLGRLGLLAPGERRRLKPADFAPEAIPVPEDEDHD